MRCPGIISHCPGCSDGSGVTWLIVGGAAVGGAVWLISKAAHTGAALMSAAVPYLVSAGSIGMLGTLAYVAVAVRRGRARNAWLRAMRPGSPLPAHVTALARERHAALPVLARQARALPARSVALRAAPRVITGHVIPASADVLASAELER
jgi:hypothetical protein